MRSIYNLTILSMPRTSFMELVTPCHRSSLTQLRSSIKTTIRTSSLTFKPRLRSRRFLPMARPRHKPRLPYTLQNALKFIHTPQHAEMHRIVTDIFDHFSTNYESSKSFKPQKTGARQLHSGSTLMNT